MVEKQTKKVTEEEKEAQANEQIRWEPPRYQTRPHPSVMHDALGFLRDTGKPRGKLKVIESLKDMEKKKQGVC
jgi:hypothetical protein